MSAAFTERDARNAAPLSARELLDCFGALHQRMWCLLHEMGSIKQQKDKLSSNSSSTVVPTVGSACGSSASTSPVSVVEDLDGKWMHKFAEMRVAICAAAPLMSELETLLVGSGTAPETGFSAAQSPAIDNLSNSSLPRAPERCTSESTLLHPTSFRDATTAYIQSPRRSARMELGDETISIVAVESERVTPAEQPFVHARSPGETTLPLVTLLSGSATSSSAKLPPPPPSTASRSPPPVAARGTATSLRDASPIARAPPTPAAPRQQADPTTTLFVARPNGEEPSLSAAPRPSFVSMTSSASPPFALSNSISRLVMPAFWSPVVAPVGATELDKPAAVRRDSIGNAYSKWDDTLPQYLPAPAGVARNHPWSLLLQEAPDGAALSRSSHIPSATELLTRHRTSSVQR